MLLSGCLGGIEVLWFLHWKHCSVSILLPELLPKKSLRLRSPVHIVTSEPLFWSPVWKPMATAKSPQLEMGNKKVVAI